MTEVKKILGKKIPVMHAFAAIDEEYGKVLFEAIQKQKPLLKVA